MLPESLMTTVERILRDPLAGNAGGIGFVGADLPMELLAATGRPFGHLPWRATPRTDWADRWLESGFPGWTRSLLEDWRDGRFDGLSDVVFSRSDDASQRLYYYVRELQQRGELAGPRARVFDIALLPRQTSLAHTARALRSLADSLQVDETAVQAASPRVDALRVQLAGIGATRTGEGPAHERLLRAALFSDATQWLGLATAPPAPQSGAPEAGRVLLAGSVPPDERLHRAVEQGGGHVVGEAHPFGALRFGAPPAVGDGPIWLALARQLRSASVAPRAVFDRAQWILGQAKSARADAVVLWLTREEESLAWHVPAQRAALQSAGLRCIVLTARRWLADDGVLDEIATFCRESFA